MTEMGEQFCPKHAIVSEIAQVTPARLEALKAVAASALLKAQKLPAQSRAMQSLASGC